MGYAMANDARRHNVTDEINADLQNWASFYAGRHIDGENTVTSLYWRYDPRKPGPPRNKRVAEMYEAALCELKRYPEGDDRHRYWLIVKFEYVYRWAGATAAQKLGVSRATYYRDRQACFSWLDGRVNK